LDTVVTDWLAVHVAALRELTQKRIHPSHLQKEFGSVDLVQPESGCEGIDIPQRAIFHKLFEAARFPARWLPMVGAAVLKHSLGNKSAANATFADINHTLPGVSLVTQMALPPDAWTLYDKTAGHTNVSALYATQKDGRQVDFVKEKLALPLAFVSEGPGKQEWLYNSDLTSLSIAHKCVYKGIFSKKKCNNPPYQPPQMKPLALPKNPLIAEVTAATGGAAGFAGSPTMYYTIARKFEHWFTKGAGIISKPYWDKLISCWPYGAQVLSPPMVPEGTSIPEAEENVIFRLLDGGYAENTALPMTLAKVQADCEAGKLDCSEPIRLILVNDGNVTSHTTGPSCCRAKDPLKSLFTDPATPVGSFVPGMFDLINVPVPTIFAEPFPGQEEWRQYNEFPSKRKVHMFRPKGEWVQDNIKSKFWSGTLTTVENKHFGVKGGQKVELLVFSLEIPGIIWPGLFDPDQTELVSPGHLREADGAVGEDPDLIAGHAPMAKSQAEAVVPVLESFLYPSKAEYV